MIFHLFRKKCKYKQVNSVLPKEVLKKYPIFGGKILECEKHGNMFGVKGEGEKKFNKLARKFDCEQLYREPWRFEE